MTLDEAKVVLLEGIDDADLRSAVEALPDQARLLRLPPLTRALVETRLAQLEIAPSGRPARELVLVR